MFNKWSWFLGIILILSCDDSEEVPVFKEEVKIAFAQSSGVVTEGETVSIELVFQKPPTQAGQIFLDINGDAVLDSDFTVSSTLQNQQLILSYVGGDLTLAFEVTGIVDEDTETEQVSFTIASANQDEVVIASSNTHVLTIEDEASDNPYPEKFKDCLDVMSSNSLDIVTWNVEQFPLTNNTVDLAVDIIENMNADVVALQEINSTSEFERLVSLLDGWEGAYQDVRGGIELAYLFKTSEITSKTGLSVIYQGNTSPFPREPVLVTIEHINGLSVTLVNIHLKCCGSSSDISRRTEASELLKEYLDGQAAGENFIVLGDFNDEISDPPFTNFVNASNDYAFADVDIENGPQANWSYPSWPSHLDHILMNKSLFDNFTTAQTIVMDDCLSNFESDVSDHRPVLASFKSD